MNKGFFQKMLHLKKGQKEKSEHSADDETDNLLGDFYRPDDKETNQEKFEEETFFEKMPGTSEEDAKEDEQTEKSSGYYLNDLGKNEEEDTKKSRPIFSFRWWEYLILGIEILLVVYVILVLVGVVSF